MIQINFHNIQKGLWRLSIVTFALVSFLLSHPVVVQAEMRKIDLTIHFEENLIFGRDDVDLYIDDYYLKTMKHGQDLSGTIELDSNEPHVLMLYKSDDHRESSATKFIPANVTTFSCTIKVNNPWIDISDITYDLDKQESVKESNTPVYKVTANTLNIRSTPSSKGKKLGALHQDDVVDVLDAENGWAKIRYKDDIAYVSAEHLRKDSEKASSSGISSLGEISFSEVNATRDKNHSAFDLLLAAYKKTSFGKKLNINESDYSIESHEVDGDSCYQLSSTMEYTEKNKEKFAMIMYCYLANFWLDYKTELEVKELVSYLTKGSYPVQRDAIGEKRTKHEDHWEIRYNEAYSKEITFSCYIRPLSPTIRALMY